jgi:ankyrin repeat protein
LAAHYGALKSAQTLVAAGAPLNDAGPDGGGPLLLSAASVFAVAGDRGVIAKPSGHEALALLLLKAGADPNQPDATGATPLHAAVVSGKVELLKALLTMDHVNLNPRLLKPLPRPVVEVVRNPFKISLSGATPFLLATNELDLTMMRMLAVAGADTGLTTKDGTTALMLAAGIERGEGGNHVEGSLGLEAVKLVLELGATDVGARTAGGQTALHGAAYHGTDDVIELLLNKGADVNSRDREGRSAYDVANSMHLTAAVIFHPTTLELLLKRGADPKTTYVENPR